MRRWSRTARSAPNFSFGCRAPSANNSRPRARGIENQDFIREDKNPNRCWVDLASFRRNYPEIAEATDVAATVLANLREEPPLENWDGTTIGTVLRATAIAMSGPLALFLMWLWRTRQVAQSR